MCIVLGAEGTVLFFNFHNQGVIEKLFISSYKSIQVSFFFVTNTALSISQKSKKLKKLKFFSQRVRSPNTSAAFFWGTLYSPRETVQIRSMFIKACQISRKYMYLNIYFSALKGLFSALKGLFSSNRFPEVPLRSCRGKNDKDIIVFVLKISISYFMIFKRDLRIPALEIKKQIIMIKHFSRYLPHFIYLTIAGTALMIQR